MVLKFVKATEKEAFENIFNHNIDAFSDSPDFSWNLDEIKKEVKAGWELYSVEVENEIIAAVFLKQEKNRLLSKNTSIKMHYQGSGYSHKIKDFVEEEAKKRGLHEIIHFCAIDNFRMYSLNESHGYAKLPRVETDAMTVAWSKKVS